MAGQDSFGRWSVALLSLAVAFTGCVKRSASTPQHDAGQPLSAAAAVQWVEVERSILLKELEIQGTQVMPPERGAHKRMQWWADRMDELVRRDAGAAMAHVPKPRIFITNENVPNASAIGAPVCYPVVVEAVPGQPPSDAKILFEPRDYRISEFTDECVATITDTARLREFVDLYNGQVKNEKPSACRLSLENGCLRFLGECVQGETPATRNGAILVVRSLIPDIWIRAGVISQNKESVAVATLAHELGHYYRAHHVQARPVARYFYDRKGRAEPGRPPRAAENHPFRADMDAMLGRAPLLRCPAEFAPPVCPQSIVDFAAAGLDAELAGLCGNDSNCQAACTPLSQAIAESRTDVVQGNLQVLEGLMEPLLSCAAVAPSKGKWDAATLRKLAGSYAETPGLVDGLANAQTLADALGLIAQAGMEEDTRIVRKLGEFTKAGFGYYHFETEADDFAIEMLARLGIPHDEFQDFLFGMMQFELIFKMNEEFRFAGLFNVGHERCRALFDAGWRDENGEEAAILFGSDLGSRPSLCYRAYNIDQEKRLHQYPQVPQTPPPAPAWADVQVDAVAFMEGRAPRQIDPAYRGYARTVRAREARVCGGRNLRC